MDLSELAARTKIPIRRLRHCIDEGLVPGLEIAIAENQTGRPRKFHEDVGFAICCAATLVAAGIDRSTVRVFLAGLAAVTFHDTDQPVIIAVFKLRARGTAQLGDNINVRIQLELGPDKYDTGWIHPGNPASLDPAYHPLTTIGLDLGQIGEKVFRW